MFPTLSLGPIALPTYPLFLLIAFWVGLWVAAIEAKRLGLDSDYIYNAGLYGLIAGIIGARIWFVLSHWDNYASDLTQVLSLSRSALSVPEGIIVAAIVVLIYLQRHRVLIGTFLDAAAPGMVVAIAIANVGAFLGGENLGAATNVPWAVDIAGVSRHPVQLYQALAAFGILGILYVVRYNPWPGFKFWLFVILYAGSRLALEIFSARPPTIGNGFLAVQVFSLLSIVVALGVMAYRFSNNSAGSEAT